MDFTSIKGVPELFAGGGPRPELLGVGIAQSWCDKTVGVLGMRMVGVKKLWGAGYAHGWCKKDDGGWGSAKWL